MLEFCNAGEAGPKYVTLRVEHAEDDAHYDNVGNRSPAWHGIRLTLDRENDCVLNYGQVGRLIDELIAWRMATRPPVVKTAIVQMISGQI
jgi:hypothetical protein